MDKNEAFFGEDLLLIHSLQLHCIIHQHCFEESAGSLMILWSNTHPVIITNPLTACVLHCSLCLPMSLSAGRVWPARLKLIKQTTDKRRGKTSIYRVDMHLFMTSGVKWPVLDFKIVSCKFPSVFCHCGKTTKGCIFRQTQCIAVTIRALLYSELFSCCYIP